MKKTLLLLILAVSIPAGAFAQNECPDCFMNIYDSLAMQQNFGTVVQNVPKDIYVSMNYGPTAPIAGISGAEFSVTGIRSPTLIVLSTGLNNPTVELGNIRTPADTTTGTDGLNIAWPNCQDGNLAFLKIQLIALTPMADNSVITIVRRFPPTNPNFSVPFVTGCDSPLFTKRLMKPGCFVVNPNPPNPSDGASIGGCPIIATVAVEQRPWGAVKSLYQ